jgi:hypothetical protein
MIMSILKIVVPVLLAEYIQKSRRYQKTKLGLIRTYLKSLMFFKFLFMSIVVLGFLYIAAAAGLLLVGFGLTQVMVTDPLTLGMVFIGLGAVFLAIVAGSFAWIFSERRWMEKAGVTELLEQSLAELRASPVVRNMEPRERRRFLENLEEVTENRAA